MKFLKTQEVTEDYFTTGNLAVSLLKFLIKPFSPKNHINIKEIPTTFMMWRALLAWLTLFMTRTCGDTPPPALAPACSLIPTTSTGLMAEQGLVESLSARRLLGPPTTLTAPTLSSWPPALHALARLSANKKMFVLIVTLTKRDCNISEECVVA